jgi:biopolymer transport protein ExbB
MDFTDEIFEYLLRGGWIMIPIVISSVAMWALIIERAVTFRSLGRRDVTIDSAICAVQGEAIEIQGKGLRAELMRGFMKERSGNRLLDREILSQCAMVKEKGLKQYLAIIAVLAAIAPLLGLLGTVLGMIETFNVIALFGTGNAKAMASGISIALITTQTGLLVAIPGMFLSGLLNRRSARLKMQLDEDLTVLRRVLRRPEPCTEG